MANLIDTVEIAGAAVYGVRQVTYTVDGAVGKDYGAALTAAAFKESTAIEDTMNSYAAVVRQRTRKLEDPGTVLAGLIGLGMIRAGSLSGKCKYWKRKKMKNKKLANDRHAN